jgi:hypothetical protein
MANIDKRSKRLWAGLVAGVMLSATFAVAAFPGSASAEGRRDEHRGGRDWHHGGGRGYYAAPPVVYGSPYYAPPVVYGPGFGINLNIR